MIIEVKKSVVLPVGQLRFLQLICFHHRLTQDDVLTFELAKKHLNSCHKISEGLMCEALKSLTCVYACTWVCVHACVCVLVLF